MRRSIRRTAMPQSWRPVTDYKVEEFGDVVIATEVVNTSRGSRYYSIYTYGQLFGTAHSLDDAKRQVEVIYGPLTWRRQANPPVEVIHYYFGRTTEFTEPTTIYTADLPMLGYAASRRVAYQMTHRPIQDGAPLHDLTQMFPPDVYTHPHYYSFGGDEMGERKTHAIVREYQGQPDKPITIYRAVPEGVTSINTGDWVTITREYAVVHSLHPTDPEQDLPIISATVPAHTLLNGGNDLLEWGYWGPSITARTGSKRVASAWQLPAEPFTAPIPSGHVRLVHQSPEPPHVFYEQGIDIGRARGIEGPKGVYAVEPEAGRGYYGAPRDYRGSSVEFSIPADEWEKAWFSSGPIGRSILPNEIIAVHESWHDKVRYWLDSPDTLAEIKSGELSRDYMARIGGDYLKAYDYVMRTASRKQASLTKCSMFYDYSTEDRMDTEGVSGRLIRGESAMRDYFMRIVEAEGVSLPPHFEFRTGDGSLARYNTEGAVYAVYDFDTEEVDVQYATFAGRQARERVLIHEAAHAVAYLTGAEEGWVISTGHHHGSGWQATFQRMLDKYLPEGGDFYRRNASLKTASKTYYRGLSLYPYPKGLRKALDNRDTSQARQLILDALDPDEVGVWWTPNFAEAERFGGVVLVGQTDAELEPSFARFPAGTIITLTDILVSMPDEPRPMMLVSDSSSWQSILDRPMQVRATRKTASRTYYHGTIWTLRSTLLPPSQTGSPANYMAGIGDPDTVYVTTDKAEAYWWGVVSAVASGFPSVQPRVYEITDLVNPRESTLYPGEEMLADSGTVGAEVTEAAKHEFKRFLADSKWRLVQDTVPQHVERYAPYLLTATRKSASLPSNLFWRAHPRTRPFDSGSASSTPIGNEWHQDYFGGTRQGFSAARDPWQLHHYIIDTGLDVSNSDIIAFRGKEVGKGVDGEPLVMPEGAPEYSQSWAGFLADLTRTPLPDINDPSRQPYAYRNSPSDINPWLAIVLYDNTDNSFYQQVLLPRIQSGQVPVFPEWLSKEEAAKEWEYFFGGTVQDAIEEFPALEKFFATRKTGNYLSELDPHVHHPDTRYAMNLITEALTTLPDPHAFNIAKQVRIYLAGKPEPDSKKEQAIQRFLIRYADKILKSYGDYPAAAVPNYHNIELARAWDTLVPHLGAAGRY